MNCFPLISLTDYSQGNSFTGRCHVSVKKLTEMMCVVEKTRLLTELVGGGGGGEKMRWSIILTLSLPECLIGFC